MPRILLAAAVTLAAVTVPSVAHGATVHQDGRTPHRVLLQADPGETNIVSVEGSNSVVIRDDGTPITVAGVPTCMPLDAHAVSCSAVRRLELDLGDGPDHAVIATPLQVEIEGGNGPDRYVALAKDWPSRWTSTAASVSTRRTTSTPPPASTSRWTWRGATGAGR